MRTAWKLIKSLKFSYLSLFLIVLSCFMLFFLMFGSVKKETYELSEFQIATNTIRSLKTVEDSVKTEQERERAASEVATAYQFSEEVSKNRQAIAASLFDFLLESKTLENKEIDQDTAQDVTLKEQVTLVNKRLTELEGKEPGLRMSNETIERLLALDVATLENIKKNIVEIVGDELSNPIKKENITASQNEVERKLRQLNVIPSPELQYVLPIARTLIVETEIENEDLTKVRKEEARLAVEPTRILQGQVIVREGQFIDKEIYRQLELSGLLKNQTSIKPLLGLVVFVLFIGSIIYLHFSTWNESVSVKKKSLFIVLSVFFMLVIVMKLLSIIEKDFDVLLAFLFPTALAPLLVKILTNERLALMVTVITAATAGVMLQEGYASIIQMEVALYILFGGLVSLYLLGSNGRRSSILRTSLSVSISNILFLAFYLLMTQSSYNVSELVFYLIAATTSGILSGALTIGLLPFFESAFGLLSDMRLIELSNPNHPLLKKVLTITPGTYHHSIMVANLADAACEEIGANGLLARVGSYYHDIGKTVRPGFFIENQHAGINPHDLLPPEKSRDIIIAHAEDGAKILEKHKMPSEIIDIARQHHGTSTLKFFYSKAKETDPDVDEHDFRYTGPKPQTKEIAIISVADSVEAAVRSMKEPTTDKIASLVKSIISEKLKDGQFDECDISMKELKKAERVFCETLNGTFHNRIEYPE